MKLYPRELEKLLSKPDLHFLKSLEKSFNSDHRKEVLLSIVNSTANLLVFLVVLPFQPIIAIIRAIKGDD